jgi:hypothetical protein
VTKVQGKSGRAIRQAGPLDVCGVPVRIYHPTSTLTATTTTTTPSRRPSPTFNALTMEPLVAPLPLRLLRRSLCPSCLRNFRQQPISSRSVGLQNSPRIWQQRRSKSYIAKPGEQATPLDGFYSELLRQPLPRVVSATGAAPVPQPPVESSDPERDELIRKARVVFGTRLAGPGRREDINRKSTLVAGVLVPPRPEEPDNCCMSGCVNCVWDLYRDDLEEWAARSAEAREAMVVQQSKGLGTGSMNKSPGTPSHVATSMDDDGGGSETNWDLGLAKSGGEDGELFANIPVGIREFMRTEKLLKERHQQERSRA